MCDLGSIGGLLFLALVSLVIVSGLTGLAVGYLLTRYYEDVMRVEAMDGKLHKRGDE